MATVGLFLSVALRFYVASIYGRRAKHQGTDWDVQFEMQVVLEKQPHQLGCVEKTQSVNISSGFGA
eukprot:SAG31_NODE_8073_length_1528_cov_1.107768_3_plen_66_part_00